MVHYLGTRFHPALGRDHQLVTPVEFLAILVPHIALRYEVNIRTYGALSTTIRKRFRVDPETRGELGAGRDHRR